MLATNSAACCPALADLLAIPGTGVLPRDWARPLPPISSPSSPRTMSSRMSAIFLRNGCGSTPRSGCRRPASPAGDWSRRSPWLHRRGDRVGVHVDLAGHVAGGPADGLDQRRAGAQEALLVGVEDRHQRDLGQVEALAQQVDADEHVELAQPQLAEQLDAAQRVDLAVQVADPDAQLEQVVGEVLGHLLGQRGDQDPLVALGADLDLVHQVVDLALGRLDDDLGVDQAGRPDDLLDDVVLDPASSYGPGSPTGRRSGRSARGTPPTAAAGCPSRSAAGSRGRPGSACGTCRPRTSRRSAGP